MVGGNGASFVFIGAPGIVKVAEAGVQGAAAAAGLLQPARPVTSSAVSMLPSPTSRRVNLAANTDPRNILEVPLHQPIQ